MCLRKGKDLFFSLLYFCGSPRLGWSQKVWIIWWKPESYLGCLGKNSVSSSDLDGLWWDQEFAFKQQASQVILMQVIYRSKFEMLFLLLTSWKKPKQILVEISLALRILYVEKADMERCKNIWNIKRLHFISSFRAPSESAEKEFFLF